MDITPTATDITVSVTTKHVFLNDYCSHGIPNVAAMIRRKLGGCKVSIETR